MKLSEDLVRRYAVADKQGVHRGYVLAQTTDEAIGKAIVKFGTSSYPYTVAIEES